MTGDWRRAAGGGRRAAGGGEDAETLGIANLITTSLSGVVRFLPVASRQPPVAGGV